MSGDSSSDRSATPEPGLSYEHLSQGKSFLKKKERTYCFIYKLFIEILCILCIFEQCLKIEIFVEKISIQICFWFVKFFVQNEIIDWKSIFLFSLFRGKKTDFSECKLIALNKYM